VQDLFLNETANYAHVFLPGSTFLEKDGTFINAERRIQLVRKVMEPKNGYADWEITCLISNAMGYPMNYGHPSEIMDEIARLTPTFAGVSFKMLEEVGSVQWPCNEKAPLGTPVMHIDTFVRGKGRFLITEYVATDEKVGPRFPLLLTTGRILSQYNVGARGCAVRLSRTSMPVAPVSTWLHGKPSRRCGRDRISAATQEGRCPVLPETGARPTAANVCLE
jgi:formate dehydrogenase major subunit